MAIAVNDLSFRIDPNSQPIAIRSEWSIADKLGALKVRATLKRKNYFVAPGLYKLGNPNAESEVMISANYKLSFDVLRKYLKGMNVWIIVLDTKGVNVWCAAGKGTFGTKELINRVNLTGIKNRINHKRIIVPQLGAPGIAAHKVNQATGLKVTYGPVRASDIKEFLNHNMEANDEMRRVNFSLFDRLVLVPVEVVYSIKYLILCMLMYLFIGGFNHSGFSIQNVLTFGVRESLSVMMVFFSGTVLGPLLLPVLPFRALALKGAAAGLLMWLLLYFTWFNHSLNLSTFSFLLASLALGSFFTMNFTGATTYTSLSGVNLEIKYAVPIQITIGVLAFIFFILSKYL